MNVLKKISIIVLTGLFAILPIRCALSHSCVLKPLSTEQVKKIIADSHFNPSFQISATPPVVKQINYIRSHHGRLLLEQESLKRMQRYESIILAELHKQKLPKELLAIPLIESSYKVVSSRKNLNRPMGIWQIVPGTARRFGLTVNARQDDRLNIQRSSAAALTYLNKMYKKFDNWMLAVMAYQYGEKKIEKLVRTQKTKNVWVLAKSSSAPKNFTTMLMIFDVTAILINNPSLVCLHY